MVIKISTSDLNVWFGDRLSLKSLNINVYQNEVLGIIGPANSGKTTFLRTLNRLNELQPNFRMTGSVYLENKDIYREIRIEAVRKIFGMVFALPSPLPISVFENIAYGPRVHGLRDKKKLLEIVENTLKAAYLWDEVKDRLNTSAFNLSGGQQQRLCIARALAIEPEVILFDEPCSGLDPISTANVEEAMMELKKKYTLILVTNNTKQAARVSDRTAFFLNGELIELDKTDKMFTVPSDDRTEGYISGKFG